MALSFKLSDPIALTAQAIGASVSKVSPGVYVLGPRDQRGGVTVSYVGRSDTDLAGRLKQHAGTSGHSHCVCSYATSAADAYAKECEMYHEWQAYLPGQIHPAAPQGSNARCAICRT